MVRQANNSATTQDEVELRFERQPVDVVRAAGLEFRQIDDAAIIAKLKKEGVGFAVDEPALKRLTNTRHARLSSRCR